MVLDVTLAINYNSDDGEIGVQYRSGVLRVVSLNVFPLALRAEGSISLSFDLSLILLPILSLERSDRKLVYLGAWPIANRGDGKLSGAIGNVGIWERDPSLIGATGSWWRRRAMEKEGGDGGGEKGGGQQDAASLLDAASLFGQFARPHHILHGSNLALFHSGVGYKIGP
uniref:Uncharacterized protein n=1 Tax=Timema douglasi TaxID=61478 RepID=A0A7R8VDX7_TIMDO|nr:unnamed protein product [Timema douglasi]